MTKDELIATLKCPVVPRFSIETVGAGAGAEPLGSKRIKAPKIKPRKP